MAPAKTHTLEGVLERSNTPEINRTPTERGMTDSQGPWGGFWAELRRRRVMRAAGVYVAAAFVALQVGEIILPAFNTPDWALQMVVVFALLGLPCSAPWC